MYSKGRNKIYEVKSFDSAINYQKYSALMPSLLWHLPVNTEHWKYNGYKIPEYYTDSRIFAVLDIKSGEIISIEGRRSPEYLKHQFLPNFDFFHFDCVGDVIILNYDIDSSIYVLDDKFKIKMKFGFSGRDMHTMNK